MVTTLRWEAETGQEAPKSSTEWSFAEATLEGDGQVEIEQGAWRVRGG